MRISTTVQLNRTPNTQILLKPEIACFGLGIAEPSSKYAHSNVEIRQCNVFHGSNTRNHTGFEAENDFCYFDLETRDFELFSRSVAHVSMSKPGKPTLDYAKFPYFANFPYFGVELRKYCVFGARNTGFEHPAKQLFRARNTRFRQLHGENLVLRIPTLVYANLVYFDAGFAGLVYFGILEIA